MNFKQWLYDYLGTVIQICVFVLLVALLSPIKSSLVMIAAMLAAPLVFQAMEYAVGYICNLIFRS